MSRDPHIRINRKYHIDLYLQGGGDEPFSLLRGEFNNDNNHHHFPPDVNNKKIKLTKIKTRNQFLDGADAIIPEEEKRDEIENTWNN